MKKLLNIIIASTLAASLCSCELDLAPKTSMGTETVSTVQDVTAVRNGVYRLFRNVFMGEYNYDSDYQSDLFNELTTSGNRGSFYYRWIFLSSDSTIAAIWADYYNAIANANFCISKIDAIYDDCTPSEQAVLNNYKGEMLLLRAIVHRQIALRFCKDYEPATASTDFGIPVITEYDTNYKPSRGTLAETYAQIESDMLEAERLVTTSGEADAAYVTVDAVTAFKAQVYLDTHRYGEASTAAASLYAKYPLVGDADELEEMWREDESSETIFQPAMTLTDLAGRYTDYHAGQWDPEIANYRCDCAYIPEQWVCDLYDDADWRVGPYVDVQYINNMANANVTGIVLTKFRGNINLQTSANLNWYNMPKIFRIADMYLIDAEAKYRSGGDAATPLNTLREHRGLTATTASGEALFTEIKNERVREMIAEGNRISDLKRWHDGFTRNKQTAEGLLFAQTGHDMVVAADADKLVWPIPRTEIDVNENLAGQQNPGWGE